MPLYLKNNGFIKDIQKQAKVFFNQWTNVYVRIYVWIFNLRGQKEGYWFSIGGQ